MSSSTAGMRRDGAILTAIFAVAALIRSIPLQAIRGASIDFPIGFVDSIYHLRRVELILAGGHLVPPFDTYSTYPTGGDFFWPPLFDHVVAAVAWIFGLGDPGRAEIAWAGAIVAPLLGAAIVVPAFFIARRLAGTTAAVVAGLVIAVTPFHAVYTSFGRPDHHGAETLLLGLYFLGLLRCERLAVAASLRFADLAGGGGRLPVATFLWTAAAAVALISVQTGAILLIGLPSGYLLLRVLGGILRSESCEAMLVGAFVPQALAAIAVFLLTLVWGGHRRLEFVYNQPSMFQATLLILFGMFPLFLFVARRTLQQLGAPRAATAAGIVVLAVAVFLILPLSLSPSLFAAVQAAGGWVGKEEIYLETVLETQPLFVRDGSWTLAPVWRHGALAFPLGLLGLMIVLARLRRRAGVASSAGASSVGASRAECLFVVLWTLAFLALAALQLRFFNFVALNLAILTGIFVSWIARRAAEPSVARMRAWILGTVVVAVGAWAAQRSLTKEFLLQEPFIMEACAWLAEETPETSHYLDPGTVPEYGIMNNPAYGHHLVYLGRRPAVSNPFFDLAGLGRAADFYLAENEAAAIEAMRAARCRYAMMTMRCYDMWYYHSLLGEARRARWSAEPLDDTGKMRRLAEGPCMGLYFSDAAGPDIMQLRDGVLEADNEYDRFRLVYESREMLPPDAPNVPFAGKPVAVVKIFELVEGALIEGRSRRGTTVELKVAVTTRAGRTFDWVRTAPLDSDGSYSFRCPYSSSEGRVTVTISTANRDLRSIVVEVPDSAVRSGAAVRVPE